MKHGVRAPMRHLWFILACTLACAHAPLSRGLTPHEQERFQRLAAPSFQRQLLTDPGRRERDRCRDAGRVASIGTPPLNYDRFCEPNGDLKNDDEVQLVLHDPDAIERVYEDAQRGDPRARRAFWRFEGLYWWIGRIAAEEMASLLCETLPICRIDWSIFDYLSKTRPGAVRLRALMIEGFEERAREKHIENQVIVATVNLLLAAGIAKEMVSKPTGVPPRLVAESAPVESAVGESVLKGKLPGSETWGNSKTLTDHFKRHGPDFGSRTATEYAKQASDFLLQARREGLPTKLDATGAIRVYDPKTNTFGAYNPSGTTRTFYKPAPTQHGYPTNLDYWNAQPGNLQ